MLHIAKRKLQKINEINKLKATTRLNLRFLVSIMPINTYN